MMKNHSVAALLCILFHLVVLFPSSIRSQRLKPPAPHNNTICTKATVIPSNVTLPYIDIPTTAFRLAEFSREPNMVFNNCSDFWRQPDIYLQFAWYKWKPNQSGFYDIIQSNLIFSNYPYDYHYVSVLQGNTCDTLDYSVFLCPQRSGQRNVYLEKGKTYYFSIFLPSPFKQTFPTGDFTFTILRTIPPPSNDECYNAIRIPSSLTLPYTTSEINVTGATINRNSELIPTCDQNYNIDRRTIQRFGTFASYWYVWTPSRTGYYKLDVTRGSFSCFSDAVPTIAVYENGNSFNCNQTSTWKQVACKADCFGTFSITEFVAGQTYYIQIILGVQQINNFFLLGYRLKGIGLSIQRLQAPPINDLCINAISIDPTNGLNVTSIDTTYASFDTYISPNEQLFCDSSETYFSSKRNGIWYKYDNTVGVPIINVTFCDIDSPFVIDSRELITYVLKGTNDCTSLQCTIENFGRQCPYNFYFLPFEENTTYYILIQGSKRTPLQITVTKNYFKLINAITNTTIAVNFPSRTTYKNVGKRDELTLGTSKLNIEAYFHPEYGVNSVYVTFDKPFRSRCERKYPFSIFGDRNGDFYNAKIPLGPHYVTATPYTGADCKGIIPTTPLKHNFTVTGCDSILGFYRFVPKLNFGRLLDIISNSTSILSLPCDARITSYDNSNCFVTNALDLSIEKVQLSFIDIVTNTSIEGDVVFDKYPNGARRISFGQRNDSAPFRVNPIVLPPSNYILTYTFDDIEHPPIRFTIQNSCTPP
jgi:hypothetical protein